MLQRRIELLKRLIAKKGNLPVGIFEALYNVFGPASRAKARPFIASIGQSRDGFVQINFQRFPEPLFLPDNIDINFIYQIVCELFRPQEWHYYEVLETKVTPSDYVMDAGAAEGLFTYLIADRCRQVYAVEPLPEFVVSMRKSFKQKSNVEILPYALGASIGKCSLGEAGIGTVVKEDQTGAIDVTTVDELIIKQNRPLTYLKADIEGYEREMLAGARESVIKYKPKIAITTYHNLDDHKFIASWLESLDLNYQIKFKGIEEKRGQPVMIHAWVDEANEG